MNHVSFIRHAPLEAPFNNYDHASLAQLDDLATNRVTPSIDVGRARVEPQVERDLYLGNTALILCAASVRANQTAEVIADTFAYEGPIVEVAALGEVEFRPSELVAEEEYQQRGMQIIRDRLFEVSVQGGSGAESVKSIYERIKTLDTIFKDDNTEQILCVTHGFLMRYLQMYYNNTPVRNHTKVNTNLLAGQINYSNLQGFRVEL